MLFATPHMLIFVVLLLMHYGVDAVQITGLSPRRGGPPGGDDPSPSPTSIALPNTPSPSQTSSTSTASTSPSSTSTSLSSTSTSPSSISTSLSSISTSLSSNASSLATSAPNSEVRTVDSRKVGTIVGSVLGSVILAGLGLMTVAYFYRRARKARKRPRGTSYFNEPTTEMSQTQNSPPLTSSAPLVHRPAPLHFNDSSTNNTSSSLIPAATFHNSLDATSSLRRPLSTGDGNSDVSSEPLQSPFESQHFLLSALDNPRLEKAVSAVPASSSTSDQLSPLHRDMAGFQKTLEADHKRDISDQSQSTIIGDPITDPPPEYIANATPFTVM